MQSFLGAPIRAHGRVFGNIYLTDKNSANEFTEDDAAAVLVLATQAGVAIANAQLYAELRLRERWLDSVREVATTLLAGDTPKATLQLVARHARELGDADMATISVPDAGGLRIIVADGVGEAELLNVEVPLAGSLSAEVIRTERTMLVADASRLDADPADGEHRRCRPDDPRPARTAHQRGRRPGRWTTRRTSRVYRNRHSDPGEFLGAGKPRARVRPSPLRSRRGWA